MVQECPSDAVPSVEAAGSVNRSAPQAENLPAVNDGVPQPQTITDASDVVDLDPAILPRAPRKNRRSREDRGLPEDSELVRLAEGFLQRQARHFPQLVGTRLLPKATPAVISEMVARFKEFHRGKTVDLSHLVKIAEELGVTALGVVYCRYSSEESQPTSIDDQLDKCEQKAASLGIFIPWDLVRADYAVSGRFAGRLGYQSVKRLLSSREPALRVAFVDDWSRASREAIESWKLAADCKRFGKRLLGASDNFDSEGPMGQMQISIFTLLSTLFLDSLRQKVLRGLQGAFLRKTNVHRPQFGFTRRRLYNPDGSPRLKANGKHLTELCIDPKTAPYRRLMYELYVEKKWSAARIAAHFNQLRVDDFEGWDPAGIDKLIVDESAIGTFRYNKAANHFDPVQDKYVRIPKPESEVLILERPELAIVSRDLFEAAQKRRAEIDKREKAKGRKRRLPSRIPTSILFRILVCGYCENKFLSRVQTSDTPRCGCTNGMKGKYGCRLTKCKKAKLVETTVMNCVRQLLAVDDLLDAYVDAANHELTVEAAKPSLDVETEQAHKDKLIKRRNGLVDQLADDEGKLLAKALRPKIQELQIEIDACEQRLKEARLRSNRNVIRLAKDDARRGLSDLRALLEQDTDQCADAIYRITGPISVFQEELTNRPGRCRWILEFTPQWRQQIEAMFPGELTSYAIEIASRLPVTEKVRINVDQTPRYEQRAAECARLRDEGVPIATIARRMKTSDSGVRESLKFHDTGFRRKYATKSARLKRTGRTQTVKYQAISPEVVRRHDELGQTFEQIAAALEVSDGTVHRAYNFGRPDFAQKAIATGTRIKRPRIPRLPPETFVMIDDLAKQPLTQDEIAEKAGCSRTTVQLRLEKLGYPQRRPRRKK